MGATTGATSANGDIVGDGGSGTSVATVATSEDVTALTSSFAATFPVSLRGFVLGTACEFLDPCPTPVVVRVLEDILDFWDRGLNAGFGLRSLLVDFGALREVNTGLADTACPVPMS
jgi:hypothetical protein